MASTRRVLNPLPENGAQKQQMLQRKENGMQAGKTPEEKETASPTVVSAEPRHGREKDVVLVDNNNLRRRFLSYIAGGRTCTCQQLVCCNLYMCRVWVCVGQFVAPYNSQQFVAPYNSQITASYVCMRLSESKSWRCLVG